MQPFDLDLQIPMTRNLKRESANAHALEALRLQQKHPGHFFQSGGIQPM